MHYLKISHVGHTCLEIHMNWNQLEKLEAARSTFLGLTLHYDLLGCSRNQKELKVKEHYFN